MSHLSFNETSFPPEFTAKYSGPILAFVLLVKTAAARGEVEDLVNLGQAMMVVLNSGIDIAQQVKGVPSDQWRTGWRM